MSILKKAASHLPERWQAEMKRTLYGLQMRRGSFVTEEPEFAILHTLVQPGDWVLDIGANVGHYTKRLSDLVGPRGRVIAFEPVPATFALLAANVQHFACANVTLFNAAVSSSFGAVGMAMPKFDSGLTNYYEAHVAAATGDDLTVLAISVDALGIDHRLALVKIDAEGHESHVLSGMRALLERHHPVLIVETGSAAVIEYLAGLSYAAPEKLAGSPNLLFKPRGNA